MKWTNMYVTQPHSYSHSHPSRPAAAEIATTLQLQATSLPPSHLFGFCTITRINPLFVDDDLNDQDDQEAKITTRIISRCTEIGECHSSDNVIVAHAAKQKYNFVRAVLVSVQRANGRRRHCRSQCQCQCRHRRGCCSADARERRISSFLCEPCGRKTVSTGAVPSDQILLRRLRDGTPDKWPRNASPTERASPPPPSPSKNYVVGARHRESRRRRSLDDDADADVELDDVDDECAANGHSLRSSFSVSTVSSSSDAVRHSYTSRSQSLPPYPSSLIVERLPAPRPRTRSAKPNNAADVAVFAQLQLQPPPPPPIADVYGRVRYQLQRYTRANFVGCYKKSHRTIITLSSSKSKSPSTSTLPSPSPLSPNCADSNYRWTDFTLDIQQAEKVVKHVKSRKQQRRWCRIITCCVGFAVLLLSLMLFSMMLTRGEKLFGPL